MFRKIMVPVDLDAPGIAAPAMETALRLAALETETDILAIAVATRPTSLEGTAEEARLEAFLTEHRGDLPKGATLDGVLTLGGAVPTEIRLAAEDMGVDLIVMASHEPRLSDLLFGSRSASVALHTPCSVLVVRPSVRPGSR